MGPGDRMGLHQFLNAVLPQDPCVHRLRDGSGGDHQVAHLLRLQASGFPLGDAWTFGSCHRVSNRCSGWLLCSNPGLPSTFEDAKKNPLLFQRIQMADVTTRPEPRCPLRPGDPCSLCVTGASAPHDCGLVCLVMFDPDLREHLHQIKAASI
jgi:hypothetical protein